jgi:subtilisin
MNSRLRGPALVALALTALAAGLPSTAAASKPIPGQYIVVLKGGTDATAVAAEHKRKDGAEILSTYGSALDGYSARLSDSELRKVKADPRVDYVTQDTEGQVVEAQTLPTGINRIDADLSTQLSGNGSGTTPGDVAIFDTGIQPTHPDLNVAGGVDCLNGYTGDDGTYNDAYGHGTHVAAIVGAKDDGAGVVGVAPGVRLWAVRVYNSTGSGSASTQLCGIDWITANGPALGIKVVNSSSVLLGGPDDGNCGNTSNNALQQAICRSTAAGILWVFGSGNNPIDYANGGGVSFDQVLTVTGMADSNGLPNVGSTSTFTCVPVYATKKNPRTAPETDDKYTSFSSYAVSAADQAHTISAPGACIYSAWIPSTYGYASGTSMAAPHATGAAHLCIISGQCPGTPAETIQKLRADAAAYTQANPSWGFTGDPSHPVAGRYYGYLIRPGLY